MQTFENLDDEKQRRIMDCAVEEFSERGFSGASINRMVAKLGIAKGSMFKYFGTKQGLFEYVLDCAVDLFANDLRAVRDSSASEEVFTRLRSTLEAGIAFIRAYPRLYKLYLKVLYQEDFPLRERFVAQAREYAAKFLRPIIEQGIRRGEMRGDVSIDWVIFYLDALFDRYLQACVLPHMDCGTGMFEARGDDLVQGVDQLMEMVRNGLVGPMKQTK